MILLTLLGIAGISFFCVNYLWGVSMSVLIRYFRNHLIRRAIDLKRIHIMIGLASLGVTTMSILTGISQKLPASACFYISNDNFQPFLEPDNDPAENYQYLPSSCKIVNGLGISILFSCLCILVIVSYRTEILRRLELSNQNISKFLM